MFQLIANVLAWFYDLVPNYAAAIALLTLAIMILLTPLTLKSTKSMLELQRLQPEMQAPPAAVQGRPPEAQRRDDGALQGAQASTRSAGACRCSCRRRCSSSCSGSCTP